MAVRVLLLSLLCLLTSLKGVCPRKVLGKAGEIVELTCPHMCGGQMTWTSRTVNGMDLAANMSSAELMKMSMVVNGKRLMILNASVNHQGNYSCCPGKPYVTLTVVTTWTTEYEKYITMQQTCYVEESCKWKLTDLTLPGAVIYNKDKDFYFPSVEEKDRGVYTCTRSYLYQGQIYNMTRRVSLDVKPKKIKKTAAIISPKMNDVFYVDLGAAVVIPCEAVLSSDFDEVFWSEEPNKSFIKTNSSFPVYYNSSRESNDEEKKMTASLVFKKVSEEDLSKNYTCKLDTFQESSSVTVSLKQNILARPSYVSLAASVVSIGAVMILAVVIYVKFKIDITLFLRDTLGCHRSSSDEKSYDAFVMCYKSNADKGLSEHDIKSLKNVLEDKFGYSLCLYDRDVLPGEAVAEAVLDCIEQSRTVLLVPTSPDPCLGSGLLSAIHAALVERQTRLVFITTEAAKVSRSGSLPEAIHQLGDAGDCVTWRGSMSPSSFFWKELRYYLPTPQSVPKIQLLPQNVSDGSP